MLNVSIWVLLPPLLGFIILGLAGRAMSRVVVLTVAWAAWGLAFVFAVIGVFGLMLAIFLIFKNFNVLNYYSNNSGTVGVFNQITGPSSGTAVICLLLFIACAAKSAQLPLYMWLPDAMEGPT